MCNCARIMLDKDILNKAPLIQGGLSVWNQMKRESIESLLSVR